MVNVGPDIKQLVDAFRELDITVGNGLIGDTQQKDPAKRALFVGLGGTGNHALRRLKRIIYQRYRNVEKNFAFVGIDTDLYNPPNNKEYMLISKDEFVLLSADDDFFDPRKRDLMRDYIQEWLNEDLEHAVRGGGAGGKRAAARALLFNSIDNVINKFEGDIRRIRTGDPNARIDVFILSGVGGGTGSGTTLDIAYILRHVLEGITHEIHGFIFMPDINTSIPLPSAIKEYIPPNAFAALKEIDYWMNIDARDDVFRQQYSGNCVINDKRPPFDHCWPITATNTNNVLVVDALNQASTVAAETICAWIAFQEDGTATNTFLKSFDDNVKQCRDVYLKNLLNESDRSYPVSFDYTVCGASVAKLPIAAINTYLACILFNRFSKLYDRAFDDQILEELPKFCAAKTIALEFRQVKSQLESKYAAQGLRTPDLSDRGWSDLFENDAERDFVYHLDKVRENAEAVKMVIINEKLNSLNLAFKEMFMDLAHGPYYLNSFIQNGSSGLIAMLDNFKRAVNNEKGRMENVEFDLEREKNEAHKNGRKAIFVTRGSHVKAYSEALSRYYINQRDKILADSIMDIYDSLVQELSKRVNALYKATFGVLDALSATFKRNIDTFGGAVRVEQKEHVTEYSWDIFSLPDIVRLVQTTLNEHGVDESAQDIIIRDMLADLLSLIEGELSRYSAVGDLNGVSLQGLDINRFLANFVDGKFKYLTQKSMKEYLEIIAKQRGETLKDYLVKQFREMERDAAPLFATVPSGASKLYYSAVPTNGMGEFKDAWIEYARGAEHRKAFPSDNDFTLVFMTFGCAAPLYEAKQLEQAETAYIGFTKNTQLAASMRLVSATKKSRENGREDIYWDWLNLPSPIPTDSRAEGSLRTKDRDYESLCKTNVKRLMDKKLLFSNKDRCSYQRLSNVVFSEINNALFDGEISPSQPTAKLKEYRDKLGELRSYLDGSMPVAGNLRERFGVFFEIVGTKMKTSLKPEWADPLHDIVATYARSLNAQRDLLETEKLFDELTDKIAEVDAVLKEVGSSAMVAEQIAKGFLCGVFKTNGKQWQYMDEDGEAQTLARGMGADRYPLFAMYERFLKLKDYNDILERIDEAYGKAIDTDTFEGEGFKVFKDQFKKERKQSDSSEDVSDSQRFVMERIDDFISRVDI